MERVTLLVLVLSTVASAGCAGTATTLRRGAWSGELALSGNVVEARYAAEDRMLEHCRGRARILGSDEALRVRREDASELVSAPGEVLAYSCERERGRVYANRGW